MGVGTGFECNEREGTPRDACEDLGSALRSAEVACAVIQELIKTVLILGDGKHIRLAVTIQVAHCEPDQIIPTSIYL
jgi:hypothetical protein